MKRREDLLRDILFLIEKSQRKGSRRLNADKNILYWEIGRLIKQDLYSKETTLHRIDTFKYLEPHNNQKQSEISKRKSLITNTFYKLTLFGCFLSLPKFPHIFDTYF